MDANVSQTSEYISLHDYAARLDVNVAPVRAWVAAGIIPVYRFTNRIVRIHKDDAAAFEREAGKCLPIERPKLKR